MVVEYFCPGTVYTYYRSCFNSINLQLRSSTCNKIYLIRVLKSGFMKFCEISDYRIAGSYLPNMIKSDC